MTIPFPAISSLLSTDTLVEQILSAYNLDKPVQCYLWRYGLNDSYVVYAGEKKAFLRIYANTTNQHTQANIQAEVDILNFLDERGVPVATAIPRKDGQYVTAIHAPEGTRHSVLFNFVESNPQRGELIAEICFQCGKALAQFHQTIDTSPNTFERHHHHLENLLDKPLERIRSFAPFARQRKHFDYLDEVSAILKQKAEALPQTKPAYGICHGDFMVGNTIITPDNTLTIIDFDFANYGWRVFDLGTFIWIHASHKNPSWREFQAALINGYESIRPLNPVERDMLPYFVLLRHIWLLGGSGLLNIQRHGIEWVVGDAFDNFVAFIREWLVES
jgi:Ser/Thr protein kinase RdoA (MazF antagonist)